MISGNSGLGIDLVDENNPTPEELAKVYYRIDIVNRKQMKVRVPRDTLQVQLKDLLIGLAKSLDLLTLRTSKHSQRVARQGRLPGLPAHCLQ